VPRRQAGRGVERRVGVGDTVMLLVAAAQTREDSDGFLGRRLVDGDFLQPAGQRAVLLDLLVFLEGGRADDTQIAGGQDRLEQGREIHRAAADRAGADRRVHFVDEQNRLRAGAQRRDDGFEPLFEVAAEAGAGEQGTGVEGEDLGILQRQLVAHGQLQRQPLSHRGLADPRLADEHRIVLATPAQDLDGAL
jgi:hypothetical protein